MRKHTLFPIVVCLLWLTACETEQISLPSDQLVPTIELKVLNEISPLNDRPPLSRTAIDRIAFQHLHESGEFRWDYVDDYVVWSAIVNSDSIVSIGYQPEGFENIRDQIHLIDVNTSPWKEVREALQDYILEAVNEGRDTPLELRDILAFGEKKLPYFSVKLYDYETIAKLRNMNVIRYVEPMGYGYEEIQSRSSGCNGSAASSIPSADYTIVSPNARVSWNYYENNIPAAWALSTGNDVTVGLIDTGIHPGQKKLNSKFTNGLSGNRYRLKYGTFESCFLWWCSNDGPDDDCGHGTGMAGTICAPRAGGQSTVGVAYEANLISVRGTDDVVINSSNEKDGVSDAYVLLGDNNDVRIISMSLGDIFYSSQVADAVVYAHNKDKLIFAAAGTSTSFTNWVGVIFPATMNETVACTGVKTGLPLVRCSNCHSGSKVDFVSIMQDRNDSDRTPLTLANTGNTPRYTGGSSIATATTAGVAALIWARDLSMTREDVIDKMKNASQFYPSKDPDYGYGAIDVYQAVASVP